MAITLTGTGGVFTRLGKLFGTWRDLVTAAGDLNTNLDDIGDEYGTRLGLRSMAYLWPEIWLDGRLIGTGSRGPITEKIQARFFDAVNGRAPEYEHWLAYV